jgi:hypothetical protein
LNGTGHEAEEKDKKSQDRAKLSIGIESRRIVQRSGAEETNSEEENGPNVPADPVQKQAESNQSERQEYGKDAVNAWMDGAEDVAPIELGRRQEVEGSESESDPGGATDGV